MESHEAMPLQEVMSPTLGPASAIRNAGMTSGPSTTTAVQVPSSLMPHGRTTVDEAAGQVGSLGTTGATYGSVATVEIVDAVGVHGFATSGPEDSGLITVQTGMMEAGVMDPAGDSGYNPPAAIPGGSTGSVGFETPRTSLQGTATAIGTAPQAFVSRTFAGLLERAQTLFTGGATVQATSPTRMPSPLQHLQQSPATVSPVPEPPLLESRHVEAAAAPLFSGANMQQMAAVECRALLLYGSPPQAPGANAESSSIPHDAIQVEVARQLAGLKQELENQRARAEHAEALLRAQVADQARSANTQPVGLGSVSGLGMDYTGSMGDSAVGSGLPSVPLPIPRVPKASSHPNPGIGLIQAKAPPPTREPQGLAGALPGFVGFVGSRTRSPGPGQRSGAAPADVSPPAVRSGVAVS